MGRFLDRLNKYFMKKHNDLETGRSMVEMLGVLAIMGVITIGGIVGYRYAMDYIMTNAIITGIRARAVIVIQQRVLGYELNLQEFHPNTAEDLIYGRFPVEAVNDYLLRGEEHQALEVFNIPHRVCKNIYNTAFGEEITLIVNGAEENPNGLDPCLPDGVTEDSADEEDIYHNVVAFVFGNGAPCEDDSDCPNAACYKCSPLGMCIPKAKDTPCGAGGCCDGNGGCTQCVIACDPDEVASTCRTSCDTSTGTWNLKAAGAKCGANNCGVCNSDGQCVGDNTKTITKCDGTPEVCCAADVDCKDESPCVIPCTGTAPACQTCDTTRGEFVADTSKNGDSCGTCGKCNDGTCNETIIGSTCCEGNAIGLFLDPSTSPSPEMCCLDGNEQINGYGTKKTGANSTTTANWDYCCPAGTAGWAKNESGSARCCSTKVIDGKCCSDDANYVANGQCCSSETQGVALDSSTSPSLDICCKQGQVIINGYGVKKTGTNSTHSSNWDYCCPAGTAGWAKNASGSARCCPAGKKVIGGYCCPNDAQYVSNGVCCDSDAIGSYADPENISIIYKCCPAGSVAIQGDIYSGNTYTFCCPAGTTGWAKNESGSARCCPTGKKVIGGYCKDPVQTCSDLGAGYVSGGCPDGTYEDRTQELDDGTVCYLCKDCPTSSSVPTGICYEAVEHVGPGSCGNYYTYPEKTCPSGTVCDPETNTCNCPEGQSLCGTTCCAGTCNNGTCCSGKEYCNTACAEYNTTNCECLNSGGYMCDGKCRTYGCCDSEVPQYGEKYYDCYRCNYDTHRWYIPENMRWCPKSQRCNTTYCSFGFSSCCRDEKLDWCQSPILAETCIKSGTPYFLWLSGNEGSNNIDCYNPDRGNLIVDNGYTLYARFRAGAMKGYTDHPHKLQLRGVKTYQPVGNMCPYKSAFSTEEPDEIVDDGSEEVPEILY